MAFTFLDTPWCTLSTILGNSLPRDQASTGKLWVPVEIPALLLTLRLFYSVRSQCHHIISASIKGICLGRPSRLGPPKLILERWRCMLRRCSPPWSANGELKFWIKWRHPFIMPGTISFPTADIYNPETLYWESRTPWVFLRCSWYSLSSFTSTPFCMSPVAVDAWVRPLAPSFESLHVWGQLNVPAVGCEGFLASYWSAFQFIRKANVILQEGYQKVIILNGCMNWILVSCTRYT